MRFRCAIVLRWSEIEVPNCCSIWAGWVVVTAEVKLIVLLWLCLETCCLVVVGSWLAWGIWLCLAVIIPLVLESSVERIFLRFLGLFFTLKSQVPLKLIFWLCWLGRLSWLGHWEQPRWLLNLLRSTQKRRLILWTLCYICLRLRWFSIDFQISGQRHIHRVLLNTELLFLEFKVIIIIHIWCIFEIKLIGFHCVIKTLSIVEAGHVCAEVVLWWCEAEIVLLGTGLLDGVSWLGVSWLEVWSLILGVWWWLLFLVWAGYLWIEILNGGINVIQMIFLSRDLLLDVLVLSCQLVEEILVLVVDLFEKCESLFCFCDRGGTWGAGLTATWRIGWCSWRWSHTWRSRLCSWIWIWRSLLTLWHGIPRLGRCPEILLLLRRSLLLLWLRLSSRHRSLLQLLWKLSRKLHSFLCLLHQLHRYQKHRFRKMVLSTRIGKFPDLFTSFSWQLGSSNYLLHLHIWDPACVAFIKAAEDILKFTEVVNTDGERSLILLTSVLIGLLLSTLHHLWCKTFKLGQLNFQIHLYRVFICSHSILLIGYQS